MNKIRNDYKKKKRTRYEEKKKEINEKRKEYIDCECGCLIQRGQLSRHKKTVKHSESLRTKNETQQKENEPNKIFMCCNVD
jgi:hypothetical protein